MPTRRIDHEQVFPATVEEVFSLLHEPSAIRKWWRVSHAIVIPKNEGVWCAAWGDDENSPDYAIAATIRVFDSPRRMVLDKYAFHSKSGKMALEPSFVTEFTVKPAEGGASLRVRQDGFPGGEEAEAFFEICRQSWLRCFRLIGEYLSHQKSRPRVLSTTPLLVVSNLDRSLTYYCSGLAFCDPRKWGEPASFGMVHRDGFDLMLKQAHGDSAPNPQGAHGIWDFYVKVKDLEAEQRALTEKGVAVDVPIRRTEYGMLELEVVDPDGYRICFGQPCDDP